MKTKATFQREIRKSSSQLETNVMSPTHVLETFISSYWSKQLGAITSLIPCSNYLTLKNNISTYSVEIGFQA